MSEPPSNLLYYGDNLDVLRQHIPDESVDLVYLDPPFNSNANYNVLFAEHSGEQSTAQIKAFEDTWQWDQISAAAYHETVEAGGDVSRALQAFHTILGDSNMLAYLSMMAPRLVELRRVLKSTGTLYLHCDPTASHYLKLLLDAVFGAEFFQNEIIWCYNVGGKGRRRWARKHDTLLFYSKSSTFYFDGIAAGVPRETGTKSFGGKIGVDADGRRYQDKLVKATGKYYRYYLDEPKIPEDWWTDINSIQSGSAERSGYPTQKPVALLERIVLASSRPGDVVLDPFCGCGTTIAAAERLKRRWIGIDITALATSLIKNRLRDTFGDEAQFHTVGEPITTTDATELAATDPYQFQWWALGLVGARPVDEKKGADKGIDGRLYFHDEPGGKTKQIILSVKAGKVQVQHLRDLRGVVDREEAQVGVLISLHSPTQPMRTEAASGGFYDTPWGKHPRLQLLTVEDLLNGERIDMPPQQSSVTFKQAPRAQTKQTDEESLF